MRVKGWNMRREKERIRCKIEGFLIIRALGDVEVEEIEEEVVEEAVGSIEITPGTTTKMPKLSAKVWLQTSNMSIQIIEVMAATIVATEAAAEETITTGTIIVVVTIVVIIEEITEVITEETIVIIEVIIKTMTLEITIEKMILTRSHIMNLRKISNKKK